MSGVAGMVGVGLMLGCLVMLSGRIRGTPELRRKVVHVGMGLVCLTFPWIFEDSRAVWMLAVVATLGLLALRVVPRWRHGIGGALHGVGRRSVGELLFAPAVALVFELADGRAALYVIPILVLTLADAAGAIAGTRWGRSRYGIGSSWKSVEGSAAFLGCAIACVALPLLVWEEVDGIKVLWISLTVGLLATMAEGLADGGTDNLVLPLWVFFLVDRFLEIEAALLMPRCFAVVLMLALVITCGRASTLDGAALLGAGLLGYGLAVLGGWEFLVPVIGLFVAHLLTTWHRQLGGILRHGREPVFGVALATLPWAAASPWIGDQAGILGCTLGATAMLLMMHCGTRAYLKCEGIAPLSVAIKVALLVFGPGLVLAGWPEVWPFALIGLAAGCGATWSEWRLRIRWRTDERGLWLMRGLLSLLASGASVWMMSI